MVEKARTAGDPSHGRALARRIAAGVLIALGLLAATAANPASWARDTALDSTSFTAAVAQVGDEPAVTDAVTEVVVSQAFSTAEVRRRAERAIAERVGEDGSPLIAAALAEALRRGSRRAVREVVESDRFAALWQAAVRNAHGAAIGVLRGEEVGGVSAPDGRVVLDLGPVVTTARHGLDATGLGALLPRNGLIEQRAQVTVVENGSIDDLSAAVAAVDTLGLVLPFVAVALLAGGVALSVARRRALIVAMVILGLLMLATLVVLRALRAGVLGTIDDPVVLGAAQAVWDVAVDRLVTQTTAILVAAIVVAAAAWLSGPAATPRRLRTWVARALGRAGAPSPAPEPQSAVSWVAAHRNALRAAGLLSGLVCLLLIPDPGLLPLLIVAGAVLVYLGVLEIVAPSWQGDTSGSS